MNTPIFILSLPRSGSTLLQRLIATHPAVATTSEPWFLLPLFLGFRDEHVFTSYRQRFLAQAFRDFLDQIPDGPEAYRTAVRRFASTLWERACGPGKTHFLDKTPRYHLIAEDLLHAFPEARWILLWRNPLAVVASCVDSHQGRWNLHDHRVDLYHGLSNLLELQRLHEDRLFSIQYEQLVGDPDRHVSEIFRYLDLAPIADASRHFHNIRLTGRMGDKKGENVFSGVSTSSRDRWVECFATLPRRVWARRYLRWIGSERLALAGYDQDEILAKLTTRPLVWRQTTSDLVRMCNGLRRVACESALFRKKRILARQGAKIDVPSA